MTATILSGNAARLQLEGLNTIFGNAYKRKEQAFKKYFDMKTVTNSAYEVAQMMENTKQAGYKEEGAVVEFDTLGQGFTPKWVHRVIALAVKISEEALDDDKYGVLKKSSTMLGDSIRDKECQIAADVLNNAFDTTVVMAGGDGLNLCSTAHVFGPNQSGTYSNRLTVDADFSEASLEALMIQIANAQDKRGKFIQLSSEKLVIAPANMFNAHRVTKSTLRSNTANNDANAVKDMGLLSGDHIVDQYLTDTDAWFVTTDASDGLCHYTRKAERFMKDEGWESATQKFKGDKRLSVGWGDPLGIFGSQGA